MKKLTIIFLATFFICTASYGATIKELLGGKDSLKLACKVEKSEFISAEGLGEGKIDARIGKIINYEIKKKNFYKDSEQICCGEDFNESNLIIEENKIEVKSLVLYPKTQKIFYSLEVKINRQSGQFREVYMKELDTGTRGLTTWFEDGTCEKVTENKF